MVYCAIPGIQRAYSFAQIMDIGFKQGIRYWWTLQGSRLGCIYEIRCQRTVMHQVYTVTTVFYCVIHRQESVAETLLAWIVDRPLANDWNYYLLPQSSISRLALFLLLPESPHFYLFCLVNDFEGLMLFQFCVWIEGALWNLLFANSKYRFILFW